MPIVPMDSSRLLTRIKYFVRGTDNLAISKVINNEGKKSTHKSFVSGSIVRQFYEETVGTEALEKSNVVTPKRRSLREKEIPKITLKTPFNINLFMKSVEAGDTKYVEKILEEHEGAVNCQDQFGWTPLMSACCAGSIAMVQLLLQWQPELKISDKRGNTAQALAIASNHHGVTRVLKQYLEEYNNPHKKLEPITSQEPTISSFYCKECKQNVENMTLRKHLSSTVHNFHMSSRRKMPTLYGIPESNKGFQILVKSGWNKEEGLGPSGEGHKFPPKTVLKQDRTGLGAKKYKARVTHNLLEERSKAVPKRIFKEKLRTQKQSEQRLERSLRRMLS